MSIPSNKWHSQIGSNNFVIHCLPESDALHGNIKSLFMNINVQQKSSEFMPDMYVYRQIGHKYMIFT